jgi:hypothetical protein
MIEYRKHKSGRQFFRIDDSVVLVVLNKHRMSSVEACDYNLMTEIATDPYETFASTEQEFKEELQVALERINQFKI